MEVEFMNDILNDLWNFHLVLIGIALSIFTLLYSFILSKRDELKSISEQIKTEGSKTNPILIQKERFAINYILRLKRINKHCVYIFLVSVVLGCGSWITHRLICGAQHMLKKWLLFCFGILTILLCCYMAFQIYRIYRHYKKETKI
jgi:hypothetical protein